MDADKRRSSTGTSMSSTSLLSGFMGKMTIDPSTTGSGAGALGATGGEVGGAKPGGIADKFRAAGGSGFDDSGPRRLGKTTDMLGSSKPVGTAKQRRFSTGTQPMAGGAGGGTDSARGTVMRSWLFNPAAAAQSISESPEMPGGGSSAHKLEGAATNLTGNASISSIAAGMVPPTGERRKKRGMRDINAMTPMNW